MEIKIKNKEVTEEVAAAITAAINAYIQEQELSRGQRYPYGRQPGK